MSSQVITEASPVVSLTEAAAAHAQSVQATQPDYAGKSLRVYIEGGGCSGLQYGMTFDDKREGDLIVESFGVTVLVDPVSADYLRGSTIDYSDALTGGGYKITNPKAKSSCGCGKSFET